MPPRLGDLTIDIYFLTVLEDRSEMWAGLVSSRGLSPWPTGSPLLLSASSASFSCVHALLVSHCVQISSSYKDTGQIGLGPTVVALYFLVTSYRPYLQIQSYSRSWELGPQYINFGGHNPVPSRQFRTVLGRTEMPAGMTAVLLGRLLLYTVSKALLHPPRRAAESLLKEGPRWWEDWGPGQRRGHWSAGEGHVEERRLDRDCHCWYNFDRFPWEGFLCSWERFWDG